MVSFIDEFEALCINKVNLAQGTVAYNSYVSTAK